MSEWIHVENNLPSEREVVVATGYNFGRKEDGRHVVAAYRVGDCWMEWRDGEPEGELEFIDYWKEIGELPQ